MPKPTSTQLWEQLVAEAGEEPTQAAEGVSVAHAESDLRAAGFDVLAERAAGNAFLAELEGTRGVKDPRPAEASSASADETAGWVTGAPLPPSRTPTWRRTLLIAAVLAAAATGGVIYALGHRSKPNEGPVEVPREVPTERTPPPAPPSAGNQAPPPAPDKPRRP